LDEGRTVDWKKERRVPWDEVLGLGIEVAIGAGGIGSSFVFCLEGGGGGETDERGLERGGEVGTMLVMDPSRVGVGRLGGLSEAAREGETG
jgi:hypothetical protein